MLVAVDFVDGQEERFAGLAQAADEFEVGGGEFGAAVDHEHDGGSFVERDAGLAENLCRDEFFVFGDDAAGVDYAEGVPAPFGVAIETVAGDAGLVPDDGAARPDQIG